MVVVWFIALLSFAHGESSFSFGSPTGTPPRAKRPPPSRPAPGNNGVLYIGDSYNMNTGIGVTVANYLKSAYPDHPLQRIAVCGSSPVNWVTGGAASKCAGHNYDCEGPLCDGRKTTRPIEALVSSKPKLVVIGLGANQLSPSGKYDLSYARSMARSVAASGALCVWIGPPQVGLSVTSDANLTKFIAELEDAVKPCRFIHSETKATRNYFKGGLHPTAEGYRVWADKVVGDLKHHNSVAGVPTSVEASR